MLKYVKYSYQIKQIIFLRNKLLSKYSFAVVIKIEFPDFLSLFYMLQARNHFYKLNNSVMSRHWFMF